MLENFLVSIAKNKKKQLEEVENRIPSSVNSKQCDTVNNTNLTSPSEHAYSTGVKGRDI